MLTLDPQASFPLTGYTCSVDWLDPNGASSSFALTINSDNRTCSHALAGGELAIPGLWTGSLILQKGAVILRSIDPFQVLVTKPI